WRWKEIWQARKEEEVRDRLGSKRGGNIRTLYKRKGVKVVPVDEGHAAGEKPAWEAGWRDRLLAEEKERRLDVGKYAGILVPKFSTIKRGEQLTPERLPKLEMGKELRPAERELLTEMLFNREATIAFDSAEKGRFHDFIEPPYVIPRIPHKAWQAASFRIPPALPETSIRLIQDRLACG